MVFLFLFFFFQIRMAVNTTHGAEESVEIPDNTLTFVIGFSILILFVILGMLASAFLCLTLKKDPFLWEAGRERSLQVKQGDQTGANCKLKDKLAMMDEHSNQDITQI